MATAQLLSREENIARIKASLGAEEVDRRYKAVYRELAKNLKLPGFRAGKIPDNVIRQRVGMESITEMVADELKHLAVDSALDELKLSPRGGDTVWHSEPDPQPGQPNEYEFSLPVLPEVTLPDYRAYELTVPTLAVTDAMKEQFRERLQARFTEYPDKDGPAAEGDMLVASFTTADPDSGEATPLSAQNLQYVIGAEGNFPGWDEQLAGQTAGAELVFDFSVPADFADSRVSGKRVKVAMKVDSVHTRVIPEITAEFVKEHLNLDSMDEFEEYVTTMLNRERDHQVQQAKSQLVLQRITAEMGAEISADMISDELDGLIKEYDHQLRHHGSSLDQFLQEQQRSLPEYRESLKPSAVQKIKTFLVVKTVAEAESLQATSEDFQRYALYLMQYEGIPAEQIRELLKNAEFVRETTYQILREKVLAHLIASAKFNTEGEAAAAPPAAATPAAEEAAAPAGEEQAEQEPPADVKPDQD
jgi:trigger factor